MSARTRIVSVQRVVGDVIADDVSDHVAVEEPLEIRIEGRPVAVTMRTPGDDLDLAAGFLYTEGVIDGFDDIQAIAHVDDPSDVQGNTVNVRLAAGVPLAHRHRADRALYASSSCGICGKATIDRVMKRIPRMEHSLSPTPALLHSLPERLRGVQRVFQQTGGIHAAALFSECGALEVMREDIGRHNAVDKVLGWRLQQEAVPVSDRILLISGRAGFEVVQKAAIAQVPVLAAVGAPSSLATELARSVGMVLIGFLRNDRFNRYA